LLFITINDWPELSNLSGQTNKGYNTCTHYLDKTDGIYLEKYKKTVYLGHHRFLTTTHSVRKKGKHFRGVADHWPNPKLRTGDDLFDMVRDLEVIFGKGPGGQSVPNDIATDTHPYGRRNLYFGSWSIGKT
jgi:hypothetical protein